MWKPVPGNIITRWAKDVTPENAWQEYPRPQMRRKYWRNLNGLWDYSILRKDQSFKRDMQGEILVPFPIESALSGVKRPLDKDETLWYRRKFTIPKAWHGKRILLHFGAVDWETHVYINNQPVGKHYGGYLPFHFDITEFLAGGENEVTVSVWDPTDEHWQQRGKQVRKPKTIWYTAVSGIWQTVWLEPVPQVYIDGFKITPDIDTNTVNVKVKLVRTQPGEDEVSLRVMDGGNLVAEGKGTGARAEINFSIDKPKLWYPASPHLYDLEMVTGEDRVESYFGMRKFSVEAGRLTLNHLPLFQFGPLDQGYWPDGLYTPPSDEAMRWELELIKRLGCNMIRKHVKVDPARYYYACDRLGLIVWQDMPNGGATPNEIRLFLLNAAGKRQNDRDYRFTGRADPASRWDYEREMQELLDDLYNFTCIGMWVPFNEAWGQYDANKMATWLKAFDETRPVDHASGWFDQGGGDCKSLHVYFRKLKPKKPDKKRAMVLSEFGGYSLRVDGHVWDPGVDFGYVKFPTRAALTEAYINLLENELRPWVERGLSAAVYTQTTDVENEVNGYVTYDREMEKMDFEKVRAVHMKITEGG